MKSAVKCESEFFLRHMVRKLSETGTGWTAMDAYLQMVETCNRCPIGDCPGMLTAVLEGDSYTQFIPYGDIRPCPETTKVAVGSAMDAAAVSESSLQSLSASLAGEYAETGNRTELPDAAEQGDSFAFARFLGWRFGKRSG